MGATPNRFAYGLGIAIGVLYLSNMTAGIFELIPDNVPLIGNLDEVGATLLIVRCLRGWRGSRPSVTSGPHRGA